VLGWATWGDYPTFQFNPMLSYVSLVPLANLLHDAWRSVRLVQVFQDILAGFGAAYLYATLRRNRMNSTGAISVGLLYAVLPETALDIRGNLDIGFAVALAPLSIAAGLQLVRTFGTAALPVGGVICGLFGFCFAPEYLLFISVPAYAFVVAVTVRPDRAARDLVLSAVGLAAVVAVGAFFVLPTMAGLHLFNDAATRVSSLEKGSELSIFSQSWAGLLGFVRQDFLLSGEPQFNASSSLGIATWAGAPLWVAAAATAGLAIRRRGSRALLVGIVLGVLLVVLSLDANVPLGGLLWQALHALPGAFFVRSPNRFMTLPFLFAVLAAGALVERIWESPNATARLASPLVLLAITGLFLWFDQREHAFTNETDANDLEPKLDAVNAAVATLGGRTVSFAYVRGGSQFYTPSYGVPTPTLWYLWDIMGRYRTFGSDGYGIFKRAGVKTVVASPDWTSDSPLLPDAGEIQSAFPGRNALVTGEGIVVKQIDGREPLTGVAISCVAGGPGLLDRVESLSDFRGFAFAHSLQNCDNNTFFDYDPHAALDRQRSRSWDVRHLWKDARQLRDADYSFSVARAFIGDDWYRNSLDGDSTTTPGGAVNLLQPTSVRLEIGGTPIRPERRTLLVRLASLMYGTMGVFGPDGQSVSAPLYPGFGMHWYALPLAAFAHDDDVVLAFPKLTADDTAVPGTWNGIAVDQIVLADGPDAYMQPRQGSATALFSIEKIMDDRDRTPMSSADLQPVARTSMYRIRDGVTTQDSAQDGLGTVNYRWLGPAGDYIVSGVAQLAGWGASISLSGRPDFDPCCTATAGYDPSSAGAGTTAILRLHLTRGAPVFARLTYPRSFTGAKALLTGVTVAPYTGQLPAYRDATGRQHFSVVFNDNIAPEQTVYRRSDVAFTQAGALGRAGSKLEYLAGSPVGFTSASLRIDATGDGKTVVNLYCDGRQASSALHAGVTILALSGRSLRTCHLRFVWFDGGLSLTAARLDLFGDLLPNVATRIWLPRGSYDVRAYGERAAARSLGVSLDGDRSRTSFELVSPGYHQLDVSGLSARDKMVAFVNRANLTQVPKQIISSKTSILGWNLTQRDKSPLEVTTYPDGNWQLDRLDTGPNDVRVARCDLVNTCFVGVYPGRYRLHHNWPAAQQLGFTISLATVALALAVLALSRTGIGRGRLRLDFRSPGPPKPSS